MGRSCTLCGYSANISLFKFPQNLRVRAKWLEFCYKTENVGIKEKMYLCSRHFRNTDILTAFTGNVRRLNKNAIPTLLRDTNYKEQSIVQKRVCLLCGTANDNRLYFRFPSTTERRKEWLGICGTSMTNKNIAWYIFLCEFHFCHNDIIRKRRPGGKSHLKPNSLPKLHLYCKPPGVYTSNSEFNQSSKNSMIITLNKHLNPHNKKPNFICNNCDQNFQNMETMLSHMTSLGYTKPYMINNELAIVKFNMEVEVELEIKGKNGTLVEVKVKEEKDEEPEVDPLKLDTPVIKEDEPDTPVIKDETDIPVIKDEPDIPVIKDEPVVLETQDIEEEMTVVFTANWSPSGERVWNFNDV